MADIADEARAEAEKRYPETGYNEAGYTMTVREAFIAGVAWLAARQVEAAPSDTDDAETRLSLLLWRLTDGRMSGTGYDVDTMVREVEDAFERTPQPVASSDTDREALAGVLRDIDGREDMGKPWDKDYRYADAVLDAGFSRTPQPEQVTTVEEMDVLPEVLDTLIADARKTLDSDRTVYAMGKVDGLEAARAVLKTACYPPQGSGEPGESTPQPSDLTEAQRAADEIHRWAFGDDGTITDRHEVRSRVERIMDALHSALHEAPPEWEYVLRGPDEKVYPATRDETVVEGAELLRRRPAGPWEPVAKEDIVGGCSEGCCDDFKCPDCGTEFRVEAPD